MSLRYSTDVLCLPGGTSHIRDARSGCLLTNATIVQLLNGRAASPKRKTAAPRKPVEPGGDQAGARDVWQRIRAYLRQHGSATRRDLAAHTGLTLATITYHLRRHADELEPAGLQRSRGRFATIYRLVDTGS